MYLYVQVHSKEVIFTGTVLPENIYPFTGDLATAGLQINTAFLPRQRPGMPKFY